MSVPQDSLHQPLLTFSPSLFVSQHHQYNQWRYCEFISSGFSLLGMIVQVVDYEIRYSPNRSHFNCMEEQVSEYYRWLCTLFTVVAVSFQIFRHHTKSMWEKFKVSNRISNSAKSYEKSNKAVTKGLVIDVFLLCIYPYPHITGYFTLPERYYDGFVWRNTQLCYTYAELLYVLMFARIYLLLRCVIVRFGLMNRHARFISARYGLQANTKFTLRVLARVRPYLMLFLSWIPVALVLATLVRVFERPFMECTELDFEAFYNALWLSMMTITTINYADYYPSTHLGRVVAQGAGIWGLFLISMMVLIMSRSFTMTWTQQKALFHINNTRGAAQVVLAALQLNMETRGSEQWIDKKHKLMQKIYDFRGVKHNIHLLVDETCSDVTDLKAGLKRLEARQLRVDSKINRLLREFRLRIATKPTS